MANSPKRKIKVADKPKKRLHIEKGVYFTDEFVVYRGITGRYCREVKNGVPFIRISEGLILQWYQDSINTLGYMDIYKGYFPTVKESFKSRVDVYLSVQGNNPFQRMPTSI
jgi:hypothetical protein